MSFRPVQGYSGFRRRRPSWITRTSTTSRPEPRMPASRPRFYSRLRELGFDSYSEYTRSPHWCDLKRRYRAAEDLPQECMCGATEGLHLHHTTYERLGAEELTDLLPLCGDCHRIVHVLNRRGDIGLDLEGLESPERAAQYAEDRAEALAQAREDHESGKRLVRVWEASAAEVKHRATGYSMTRHFKVRRLPLKEQRRLERLERHRFDEDELLEAFPPGQRTFAP